MILTDVIRLNFFKVLGGLRRFDAPRELSFLLRIVRRATILMGWHRQSIEVLARAAFPRNAVRSSACRASLLTMAKFCITNQVVHCDL